ncbi:hypothetical protein JCM9534A_40890 [Catenuloplanes indicus JCM 9534]
MGGATHSRWCGATVRPATARQLPESTGTREIFDMRGMVPVRLLLISAGFAHGDHDGTGSPREHRNATPPEAGRAKTVSS